MSYYNNKPRRKINPPKRFRTENTDTNTNTKKVNNDKNNHTHKNKHCSICNILIDIKYMYCFDYNTKIYCDVCYNDLKPIVKETKETPTPKINFIIMNKFNPNLIKINANKIQKKEEDDYDNEEETDKKEETEEDTEEETEEDTEEETKEDTEEETEEDTDEEEETEEDTEEETDEEADVEEEEEETNTLFNFITATNNKKNNKNNNYYYNYNEKDVKNTSQDTEFNNLFFSSLINRLDNITSNNNIFNNETIKNQKNKGNKNKDEDEEEDITLDYEWLGSDIKDIDDLIRIGKTYNPTKRKRHNLNLKKLNKLVEPLTELKNMIGMKEVKKIIFDQLIYYLQNLDDKNVDMLHTVIVGPPGVGKTQLTYIIAKIYNKLGFLKTDKVICAKRDDLIGEYIGQTAPKTRKVLDSALGGVLLLDEVYALSPNSEKDFAREAIDMINVYLSEHCHDLVCVIAGYKRPTYDNFLKHNEGLARRFTHHFEIKGYDAEELTLIFKKYVEEQKWGLLDSVEKIKYLIEKHLKLFPNFGGDMTTLFACCKKTHSKRLLLIPTEEELNTTKKKIHIDDIEKGIQLFIDIKEKGSEDMDDKDKYVHMYS